MIPEHGIGKGEKRKENPNRTTSPPPPAPRGTLARCRRCPTLSVRSGRLPGPIAGAPHLPGWRRRVRADCGWRQRDREPQIPSQPPLPSARPLWGSGFPAGFLGMTGPRCPRFPCSQSRSLGRAPKGEAAGRETLLIEDGKQAELGCSEIVGGRKEMRDPAWNTCLPTPTPPTEARKGGSRSVASGCHCKTRDFGPPWAAERRSGPGTLGTFPGRVRFRSLLASACEQVQRCVFWGPPVAQPVSVSYTLQADPGKCSRPSPPATTPRP